MIIDQSIIDAMNDEEYERFLQAAEKYLENVLYPALEIVNERIEELNNEKELYHRHDYRSRHSLERRSKNSRKRCRPRNVNLGCPSSINGTGEEISGK